MAIHTISNNCVVVSISDSGAELQSIKSSDGREYLWQGSPAYWARRSPVLFPFVGALMNDSYTYCGNTYKMSQHGFARDMNFSFEGKDGSNISFVLNSDDKTFEIYPFDFLLRIEYSLNSNSVVVKWTVKNTGDTSAYLKIALSLTIDGDTADIDNYIEFNISDTSWIFKDGYYYYNTALAKDNTTNALFTKMHFKGENISSSFIGKVIELKITVYGVASENNGSSPFDATGWPV